MTHSKKKSVLPQLQWHIDVYHRLVDVLTSSKSVSSRKVATFDLDNTCILNDLGELFSHYLIENMLYRYDLNAFWDLIDVEDGRDHIFDLTQQALLISPEQRPNHPIYQRYLCEMGALYYERYCRLGKANCYQWAVRLHLGLTPDQVRHYATQAIQEELKRPLFRDQMTNSRGNTIYISRGIRIFQEIYTLMEVLRLHGYEVWLVSASNQWAVESLGKLLNVSQEFVIGNQVLMDDSGTLSHRTKMPVLFGPGKVEAIQNTIGTMPLLAFGDAETDFDMLCEAKELAVFIDSGNTTMKREANARNWAIQPQELLTTVSNPEQLSVLATTNIL